MISVYVCTWNAGAVSFFVVDSGDDRPRVVDWKAYDDDPSVPASRRHDPLIRRALAQLQAHLRSAPAGTLPPDGQVDDVKLVWFAGRRNHSELPNQPPETYNGG